jgi:hypothetical protein
LVRIQLMLQATGVWVHLHPAAHSTGFGRSASTATAGTPCSRPGWSSGTSSTNPTTPSPLGPGATQRRPRRCHLPAHWPTLVVETGNSGHDIAQDLFLRGTDVTLLQRSGTTVASVEPSAARLFALFRDGEGVQPLEDTDLIAASVPNLLTIRLHRTLSRIMQEDDRELLDGLRNAGFLLDNGEDDTGFNVKSMRYFVNVKALVRVALQHSVFDVVLLLTQKRGRRGALRRARP